MSKEPADRLARDKITSELEKNFFVEAGPGSGKTKSLVDRLAALIEEGVSDIGSIAAVTFTRKAAAELRERFQIKLEDDLNSPDVPSDKKDNIRKALLDLERAFIGTIHSFCAKLLRERPVEAGVDPGFRELEEQDEEIYARELWSDHVERRALQGDKRLPWMRDNGVSPRQLVDAYLCKVRYSEVLSVSEPVERPDFTGERKVLRSALGKIHKEMPEEEPPDGWDMLQSRVVRAIKLMYLGFMEEERRFIALLRALDCTEVRVTKNRWQEPATAENMRDVYTGLLERTVRPALLKWREYLHQGLMEFVEDGVGHYQSWREERSILNFQDLLLMTARLLRENTEVRAYFRGRIKHLLVDEFQDTDPIQAEIVMYLTAKDDAPPTWRECEPVPGSLFVVGDPKQSIYRFRRADIDIYNQVKELFSSTGGEILELTANFRSRKGVGDFSNRAFEKVFPVPGGRYQACFAPVRTIRPDLPDRPGCVLENPVPKVPGNIRGMAAETDARRIAAIIHSALKDGVICFEHGERRASFEFKARPGDFMVLTKKKDLLPVYAKALEELGLPYELSGGENLSASEELGEILNVFKAVADPDDPIALVAALRGVFFGISDNELYLFRASGGMFSYMTEAPEGATFIKNAFASLREFRALTAQYLPITAAEKIIESLGILPLAVSLPMGSTNAGNILKSLELLRCAPDDGSSGFPALVDRLAEYLSMRTAEEMSLFPCREQAVRVMNVHRAKGLEAPVVFLADPLGEPGEHEPALHVSRTEQDVRGHFKISAREGRRDILLALPPDWTAMSEEAARYEEAEKRRLEYVAITRAKDLLFISTYPHTTRRTAWETARPVLSDLPVACVESFPPPEERQKFEMDKPVYERGMRGLAERRERCLEASWRSEQVSSLAGEDHRFTGGRAGGKEWGELVHKALETFGKHGREKLHLLAGDWFAGRERSSEELNELLRTVEDVAKGELWMRVSSAREKFFEVPFAIMDGDALVNGVMDLVFKGSGGWVIVDYKTDDFEKDPARREVYQRQLDLYARYWEGLTGETVKEKILLKAG